MFRMDREIHPLDSLGDRRSIEQVGVEQRTRVLTMVDKYMCAWDTAG